MKKFVFSISFFIMAFFVFTETGYKGLQWGSPLFLNNNIEGQICYDPAGVDPIYYYGESGFYTEEFDFYGEKTTRIYDYSEGSLGMVYYKVSFDKLDVILTSREFTLIFFEKIKWDVVMNSTIKEKVTDTSNPNYEDHINFIKMVILKTMFLNYDDSFSTSKYIYEDHGDLALIASMDYNDDTKVYLFTDGFGVDVFFLPYTKPDF